MTKANLATVLPQLQLDAQVKTDIQNAVNAGKVVTVSKTDINFHGWVGCGYVIVDATSGAGAYMIGGGLSGAEVQGVLFLVEVFLYCLAAAGAVAIALLAIIFAMVPGAFAATLPTFASAIAFITPSITAIANFISSSYLSASIYLASFAGLRALYSNQMVWADLTPPILPFPTTWLELATYTYMYFRLFLLHELFHLVHNIQSHIYVHNIAMNRIDHWRRPCQESYES